VHCFARRGTHVLSSAIAKFPRRTAEYKLCASLYGLPAEPIGPFRTESLHKLQDWHAALACSED